MEADSRKGVENKVRQTLQLEQCTYDASVKMVAEYACWAYCAVECSESMANNCCIKDTCPYLEKYCKAFVKE